MPPAISENTFSNIAPIHVLYVPKETIEIYLANEQWSKLFPKILAIFPDYGTTISDGIFVYDMVEADKVWLASTAIGEKLSGDVVLPDETMANGTRYEVTNMLCSFYDILDIENLTSLDIQLPITSIPSSTFFGAVKLKSIKFPSTLLSIEDLAFRDCTGLTGSLIIPNSVTSIGRSAFYGCSGFTGSLTIGNSVTSIGESAFQDCNGFTGSLNIPNSVTNIGFQAFFRCSGFTGSLTIPNSVTSIEAAAFYGCSGFTGSLTIPNSVTSIGIATFANCSGFTGTLSIPNSVISIGSRAFSGCSGFTSTLSIPNSVNYIGDMAFMIYDNRDFKITSTVPPTIDGQPFLAEYSCIGVPIGYGADYRANEGWAVYDNLYEFGDANIDKRLTISDAVAVANNIIDVENSSFNSFIADINFDEHITVNDAAHIVDAVLTYNPMETVHALTRSTLRTSGVLAADDFHLNSDSKAAVDVYLNEYRSAVALQCDFIVGNDIAIDKIVPDATLAETHTLKMQPLSEGRTRVVIFSLDNKAIDTKGCPLFTIYLHGYLPDAIGSLQGEMVTVSTPDATDIELRYSGGNNLGITGITGIIQSVPSVIGSNGTVTILNAEGIPVDIYSIDGRKVDSFIAASNTESRRLSAGIYIIKTANITTKVKL